MTPEQRAGLISGAIGCSCIHVEKDAYSGPDWRGGKPPPRGCTYCRAVWEIRVAIQEEREAIEATVGGCVLHDIEPNRDAAFGATVMKQIILGTIRARSK